MVVIKRLMATMLVVGSLVSFSPVMATKDGGSKQTSNRTAKVGHAVRRHVNRVTLHALRRHVNRVTLHAHRFLGRTIATHAGTGAVLGSVFGPVGIGAGATIGAISGLSTAAIRYLMTRGHLRLTQLTRGHVSPAPTSLPTAVVSGDTAVPTAVPTPTVVSTPAAPTSVPTSVPTVVSTSVPTVVSTALPTAYSTPIVVSTTAAPTSVPTVVSTALPTAPTTTEVAMEIAHEVAPTAYSTPIVVSTAAPTSVPTVVSTAPTTTEVAMEIAHEVAPTVYSTPIVVPTVVPTAVPSMDIPMEIAPIAAPPIEEAHEAVAQEEETVEPSRKRARPADHLPREIKALQRKTLKSLTGYDLRRKKEKKGE